MAVLKKLNPILRGWANYFRIGVSAQTFRSIDCWMFKRCVRYVKFTHPKKGWRWCKSKYWGALHPKRADRWVFGNKHSGAYLLKLSWIPIERHTLVKGAASPDDLALKDYWTKRRRCNTKNLPPRQKTPARFQKGLCSHCQTSLFNGEELHIHHLKGRREPDSDKPANLRLVHLYCHQQIHATRSKTLDAKRLA